MSQDEFGFRKDSLTSLEEKWAARVAEAEVQRHESWSEAAYEEYKAWCAQWLETIREGLEGISVRYESEFDLIAQEIIVSTYEKHQGRPLNEVFEIELISAFGNYYVTDQGEVALQKLSEEIETFLEEHDYSFTEDYLQHTTFDVFEMTRQRRAEPLFIQYLLSNGVPEIAITHFQKILQRPPTLEELMKWAVQVVDTCQPKTPEDKKGYGNILLFTVK